MKLLLYILIPCILIYLSIVLHRKLVKRSKNITKTDFLINKQEFKGLCLRAFSQFQKPHKYYHWMKEFNIHRPKLNFSEETFKLFLAQCSEEDLKYYWPEYHEILNLHIKEKDKLTDNLLYLHDEFELQYHRIDALINHKIIEAFFHHPNLLIDIENFSFQHYLKTQQVLN